MSSISEMIENAANSVEYDDYVVIVKNGCYEVISYENFIKNIALGGLNICDAVMRCWDSMGDFDGDAPTNNPPLFDDIFLSRKNRTDYDFTEQLFISNYYDAENDELGYVVIKGGDMSGYTFNGEPIYPNLLILKSELHLLKYTAKNQDSAYRQSLEIDVFDVNNVKAE